jgi:hypothetical protein
MADSKTYFQIQMTRSVVTEGVNLGHNALVSMLVSVSNIALWPLIQSDNTLLSLTLTSYTVNWLCVTTFGGTLDRVMGHSLIRWANKCPHCKGHLLKNGVF